MVRGSHRDYADRFISVVAGLFSAPVDNRSIPRKHNTCSDRIRSTSRRSSILSAYGRCRRCIRTSFPACSDSSVVPARRIPLTLRRRKWPPQSAVPLYCYCPISGETLADCLTYSLSGYPRGVRSAPMKWRQQYCGYPGAKQEACQKLPDGEIGGTLAVQEYFK